MPTIQELQHPELIEEKKEHTTTYRFEGKDFPLFQKHNITQICKDILTLNETALYLPILLNGKSSSGKSTLCTTIIHRVSCMQDKKYIVKWFKGKDLLRLDEIANELEKGLQYILAFDDCSYILDQAPPKVRKKVAEVLTQIRHIVKGKVISFFCVHFNTSILPIFRDSYIRILTSASDEDNERWKKSFGKQNTFKLAKYQKQFASQMLSGYFFVNMENKSYRYTRDKPYRVALCADLRGIHTLLYPKEECNLCAKTNIQHKQKISEKEIWNQIKTYGKRANPALEYYAYFVRGKKDLLPTDKARAVNLITRLDEKYDFDLDKLISIAASQRRHWSKKLHVKKNEFEDKEEIILEKSGITSID